MTSQKIRSLIGQKNQPRKKCPLIPVCMSIDSCVYNVIREQLNFNFDRDSFYVSQFIAMGYNGEIPINQYFVEDIEGHLSFQFGVIWTNIGEVIQVQN